MQTPKNKKELRTLCGMISSLGDWFPSIQFNIKNLRSGCGEMKRFEWTKIMETEFKAVKHIFTHQIRLSPLDMDKKINIATDGANSAGIGFIVYQNANDLEEGKDVKIIKANSSGLKDSQKQYSAIDTELLALKFACDSSYYYLYGAKEIHVYTDSSGLEGMFNKPLGNIKNLRIRSMIEKLMMYNFVFHHVPAESNQIVDCLSRLTREIKEAEHFSLCDAVLADHKKIEARIKTIKASNAPTEDDPWVEYLGKVAMTDKDYITMVHHIEAGTEIDDIDKECELSNFHNFKTDCLRNVKIC